MINLGSIPSFSVEELGGNMLTLEKGTFYNNDFEGNWAMRHRYVITKQNVDFVANDGKAKNADAYLPL